MESFRNIRATRQILAGLCALAIFLVLSAPVGADESAAEASSSLDRFPDRVEIEHPIFGSDGQPLTGRHNVLLTYFDKAGTRLYTESLPAIDITDGQLGLELGSGTAATAEPFQNLQAVFASHPEVDLEISVDGQAQSPRIGILPAGHSLKSRLVAAGVRDDDDDELHWKHYEETSGGTATQAATLNPAGPPRTAQANIPDHAFRRRPFTVPVLGPFRSRPVRDLPIAVQQPPGLEKEINRPRHEGLVDAQGRPFGTVPRRQKDLLATVAESTMPAVQTPSLSVNFDGIANVNGVLPPDTEGAVGPNHYVQVVNLSFAVYDKAGSLLYGPVNTNSLWSGFGGACQSNNSGDAIFLYDEHADRWVLSQFAAPSTTQTVCFAVSQTPDPLGAYDLYEVNTPRFPDYFKLGVWPDADNNAYFMGTNSGFAGQYDVFAMDRASMLAGVAARSMQLFQNFSNLMMPADLDAWQGGAGAPPSGSPGLFYTFRDGSEPYFGSPPTDSIDVWEFDVDWNTPANSTYSRIEVITPTDGLVDFNWTICGFFVSNCIPQPGTTQGIDSASWWPMQRLVYQNYGSHESLFGTWTVDVLPSGDRAAPRWFELRRTGSSWVIHDQGTHSPDAIHRWMPSIAADISGNIAVGYSRGDGSNFASIYYATREASDPPGTLQAEALMHAATGAQTHSAARWGDYSSMELDPSDGCTFWYTTEYVQTTGSAPWRTRVGAFTISSCGGPRFTLSCSPSDLTAELGNSDSSNCDVSSFNGYADPVALSCVGLPTGVSCVFDTISTNAPYSSGLTVNTDGTAPLGDNAFSVEATDGVTTRSVSMNIRVLPVGGNGPQEAVYDGGLGAPLCSVAGSECDSVSLLDGRANLGPEPNQPNTLDSCTDGATGTYHSDESNDRLVVRHIDSVSNLAEGVTAVVEATVWAWNDGSLDTLDLYYAADANSPSWVLIGSQVPPSGGPHTLTAQYTLPAGALQAVRANFRYQGSQSTCSGGAYDDADDLVFAVALPVQCTVDADCDNSLFCDGAETCNAGTCQAGTVPDCDDSLFCNGTESCNEATDSCDPGTPPACDDGAFCNGTESCNEGTDSCDAGTPVACGDGQFCNGAETCNEGTDSCDPGTPPACDDGAFCNGAETCNEGTDSCDAGVDQCTGPGESCDETNDVCTSGACNNNLMCEAGEDCNNCPNDCISGTLSGADCGNNICEAGDGENATSCSADCNGITNGNPSNRFSCGFGDTNNNNSVGCSDSRCTTNGWQCTEIPAPTGNYCCGDTVCEGAENTSSCSLDCGDPPVCGNNAAEEGEDCDGTDLAGESCESQGFSSGTLACLSTCEFDTSGCGPAQCVATHSKEKGPRCSDGLDNDCDGNIDEADPDC